MSDCSSPGRLIITRSLCRHCFSWTHRMSISQCDYKADKISTLLLISYSISNRHERVAAVIYCHHHGIDMVDFLNDFYAVQKNDICLLCRIRRLRFLLSAPPPVSPKPIRDRRRKPPARPALPRKRGRGSSGLSGRIDLDLMASNGPRLGNIHRSIDNCVKIF
jgi:hypothetical protein